jgi:hypothetical protein
MAASVSLSRVELGTAGPGGKLGATLGKMPDERGLFLTVTPARGKSWRWRYSFDAKQRLRSSGTSGVRLTAGSDGMPGAKKRLEYPLERRAGQLRMKLRPAPFVEFLDRVDYFVRIAARRTLSEKFPDAIRYQTKSVVNLRLIECAFAIDLYAHIVDSNDLFWLSVFQSVDDCRDVDCGS